MDSELEDEIMKEIMEEEWILKEEKDKLKKQKKDK